MSLLKIIAGLGPRIGKLPWWMRSPERDTASLLDRLSFRRDARRLRALETFDLRDWAGETGNGPSTGATC